MTGPLDIFARLEIVGEDGTELNVFAGERTIRLECGRFRGFQKLLRSFDASADRKAWFSRIDDILLRADLSLEIRIAQRIVARLGPLSRPNFWSRILRAEPAQLYPFSLLVSWVARR
jgi:hypothetical protein